MSTNNVQTNLIPIIEVGEGTNSFHRELTERIVGEFASFLKIHKVIDSENYQISQVKFRKSGIKKFIKAVEDKDNPVGSIIKSAVGSENVDATTAVTMLGALLMCRMNAINDKFKNKMHYGLRLRSDNRLGIFLTIGVQDLQEFFQRGQEKAKERLVKNAVEEAGALVDPEAIQDALEGIVNV
jgi:hypothetical protein